MRSGWVLALAGGCYSPRIQTGAPCDEQHPCPSELTCSTVSHACELTGGAPDGGIDPPGDGSGMFCAGTGLMHLCFAQPPTEDLTLAGAINLNTDSDSRCQDLDGAACVIVANHIAIPGGSTLLAHGHRPLVLLGASGINIAGTIDVASRHGNNTVGAGGDAAGCVTPGEAVFPAGGPGGSFTSRGGDGGGAAALHGDSAGPGAQATSLRGGCPGSDGGNSGGNGGHGGGVAYLISNGSISISGNIDASGAGGSGGPNNGFGGGGGGGSGGLIGLDAPSVAVMAGAMIYANGGGGGGGGDTGTGTAGSGADPSSALAPAAGGAAGGFAAGNGGSGSQGTNRGTNGSDSLSSGAGGGGGGAGAVRVFPLQQLIGNVSPPAT